MVYGPVSLSIAYMFGLMGAPWRHGFAHMFPAQWADMRGAAEARHDLVVNAFYGLKA